MGRILTQARPLTDEQRAAMRGAKQRMTERARAKGWAKRASYGVQAALLLPLVGLLKLLPVDIASRFGGWFGRQVVYRMIDRRAHYETMRVVLREDTDAKLDAILREMCENVGRVLGETMHLQDFAGAGNSRLVMTGVDRALALHADGRPLLFLSGHFGNWELVPVALRAAGLDGMSVVQHPNNPHLLELIAAERFQAGLSGQIGAGEGVYASLRRQLKGGGIAAMLVDQRVLNGIKARFFGLETVTNPIPARLAREFGAAVVLMTNRRVGGAHFAIEFSEPILVSKGSDRAADELALTERVNRFYEEQIRDNPAYWLWGHPRFDDVLYELDVNGKRVGPRPRKVPVPAELRGPGDETATSSD